MSTINVTLEAMTVKQKIAGLGTIDRPIPQMRIWGQIGDQPRALVGYVGTQPNAPINIIVRDLPKELHDDIVSQVKSQLETVGNEVAVAPTTQQMKEYNAETAPGDELDDSDDPEEA